MAKKFSEIYPVKEDSILLSEVLKKEVPTLIQKNANLKILDMGSGSGIQAQTCLDLGVKKENLFLVDINKIAVKQLKKEFPRCKVISSNLFSKIPNSEKFDLIIFNPPYLPEEKFDKMPDTSSGKFGSKTINQFLKNAKKYGKKNFSILLLASSLTKEINFLNYKKELLCKKNLFFEKLFVWKLK